jgi:Fe-S-cluster containining protein
MADGYENDDGMTEVCVQCGLCCKIYGDRITPTINDLYSWMVNEKNDILRYFTAFFDNDIHINCASLQPSDLGEIISIEMRHPDSGEYPTVCPFLRRVEKTKYICSIHKTKPEMCCNFTPWVRRQTEFDLCKALKNASKKK